MDSIGFWFNGRRCIQLVGCVVLCPGLARGVLWYGYISLEGAIMATGHKRRMSLSTQVLVGLVLGLLA
ncbi:MAG TPA: hypothetical protein VLK82_13065, partial [Candidatus Tectomicrobia bacterium]|nr:hypothetical protein [Candidatus Tectomicrobia bacterium]